MVFTHFEFRNGWTVPVDAQGKEDWTCWKCGHKHTSCCGNSHFPCTEGPNYGGKCDCDVDRSFMSVDGVFLKGPVIDDGSLKLLDGTLVNKGHPFEKL